MNPERDGKWLYSQMNKTVTHLFLYGVASVRQNLIMEELNSSIDLSFSSVLDSFTGDSTTGQISPMTSSEPDRKQNNS